MIFTERKIMIFNNTSSIDKQIVLYRGDKNVEIRFTISELPSKYSRNNEINVIESTEASFGQLIIKVPNDKAPIFSDIVANKKGSVVFTITGEMIDEISELGTYDFQIRLFDGEQNSRATIPPIEKGIEIREPIATEGVSTTNEVDVAVVNYAVTTTATALDAFDENGNYIKTTWSGGDVITSAKLNKIEAGIDGVNQKIASSGTGGTGLTTEQAQQLSTAYQHSQSTHAPSNAEANVQADWNITDTNSDAYIKNKPTNLATTDQIPAQPNFTYKINMVASDQTATVTTTGTYPNLIITFNIPQSTTTGGSDEPIVAEKAIYYGRLSISEVGGSVVQYSAITDTMILNGANITKITPQTLGKTSVGKQSETAEGDYVIIAVPNNEGYVVTRDNGIGGKVIFNKEVAGANGDVILTIDGNEYAVYGEILISPAEIFIYIDKN